MDGIIIRKAILHILDNGNRGIILSNSLLNLRDEELDFIHNLIGKIHGNDNSKHGKFYPETSLVYELLKEMNEDKYLSYGSLKILSRKDLMIWEKLVLKYELVNNYKGETHGQNKSCCHSK